MEPTTACPPAMKRLMNTPVQCAHGRPHRSEKSYSSHTHIFSTLMQTGVVKNYVRVRNCNGIAVKALK